MSEIYGGVNSCLWSPWKAPKYPPVVSTEESRPAFLLQFLQRRDGLEPTSSYNPATALKSHLSIIQLAWFLCHLHYGHDPFSNNPDDFSQDLHFFSNSASQWPVVHCLLPSSQ